MATEAQIAKSKKTPKFSTRKVNRCYKCGRHRGYMRDFGLCRICFKEKVADKQIPGVTPSSW
jgi:small subunit ribosomal protein S14